MRTLVFGIASSIALSISSAAFAEDPAPATAAPTATTTASADKIICRRVFHEGIATNRVQCGTQAEWDRARRQTEKAVSDLEDRSMMQLQR